MQQFLQNKTWTIHGIFYKNSYYGFIASVWKKNNSTMLPPFFFSFWLVDSLVSIDFEVLVEIWGNQTQICSVSFGISQIVQVSVNWDKVEYHNTQPQQQQQMKAKLIKKKNVHNERVFLL